MDRTTKMKILLCVPIVMIVLCYIGLLTRVDAGTLYLQDIQGNRDFLKPFTTEIELAEGCGDISDKNIFVTADGITRENVEEEHQWKENVGTWKGNPVYVEDHTSLASAKDAVVETEVKEGAYQQTIQRYDKGQVEFSIGVTSGTYHTMKIKPNFVIAPENGFEEHALEKENVIEYREEKNRDWSIKVSARTVLIGEDLYTAVLTKDIARGNSGIYRTNMQELNNTDVGESFEPSLFLEIPVDKQKAILGLEAAGENLALFTKEDNVLWLNLYNTKGELLARQSWDTGEQIDEFTISRTAWQEGTGFVMHTSKQIDENSFFVTKEVYVWVEGDTIKEVTFAQKDDAYMKRAVYKNLCLDISLERTVPKSWNPFYKQYNNTPGDYIFTVYDANGIVYQGRLVTDWNDDFYQCYGDFYTADDTVLTIAEQAKQHISQEEAYRHRVRLVWEMKIKGNLEY